MAEECSERVIPYDKFAEYLQKERDDAWKYGGRTVKGFSKPPKDGGQLNLF